MELCFKSYKYMIKSKNKKDCVWFNDTFKLFFFCFFLTTLCFSDAKIVNSETTSGCSSLVYVQTHQINKSIRWCDCNAFKPVVSNLIENERKAKADWTDERGWREEESSLFVFVLFIFTYFCQHTDSVHPWTSWCVCDSLLSSTMVHHKEFEGAGKEPGLRVWRIENMDLKPVPKALYGNFYSGDAYVLLFTTPAPSYNIHMWLGKTQEEQHQVFYLD